MKKRNVLFVLLAVLVMAVPMMADTGIIIPVPGLEVTWIDAALACFGIGLVYVINFIKTLAGWQDKKAVVLTIVVSIAAAAATLLIKSAFNWKFLAIYSLAVLGELTGWFKLTKKAA